MAADPRVSSRELVLGVGMPAQGALDNRGSLVKGGCAQPGTARGTCPAQRPSPSLLFSAQNLLRQPDVKRRARPVGAKWGAIVSRQGRLKAY